MAIQTPVAGPELEEALEKAAALPVEPAEPAAAEAAALEDFATVRQEGRVVATAATTVLAASLMLGGIFIGVSPRVYAAVAGAAGIALATFASRTRRPALLYAFIASGIFLTGVLLVLPSGLGSIMKLGKELRTAAGQGGLLRPPVLFLPGWHAILGWIMACVGFGGTWIALEMRRPALGLLVPVPLVAFGAVSVPKDQQLASGLAALVLLAAGLALLSGLHERGAEDEPPGLAYELRRGARALPLVGGVTVLLYFLSRSSLLFPPPLYDPTQQARKPKTIPLSEVKDRVLFEVKAQFSGPWKLGTLDVYDGRDWRLPPFDEDALIEVPKTGIVDSSLSAGAKATFTIRGMTGAVLPGLANTVGLIAEMPKDMKVSYDRRAGTLRVTQGQTRPGFRYTVVAAGVPKVEQLRVAARDYPDEVLPFLEVPKPPPAVQDLLLRAPRGDLWGRLDFLRQRLLKKVRAAGQGMPVSVTPRRVDAMLTTDPVATPFEIVAAQALLARWAGIPARIGYGFDKGEPGPESGVLLIRPRHGAVFMEVYFSNFGWLPIIGDPQQAQASFSDVLQQFSRDIAMSDDLAVPLFVPQLTPPEGELFRLVRRVAGAVIPAGAGVGLVYILWPLPYKAVRRTRRRTWAVRHGPATRIALAYAEWRDAVTDYGYRHGTDPALLFVARVVPDDEHAELAWLVTRTLWGDLRGAATGDDAATAEELSLSLRRRLARAHPWSMRAVSALSRVSVRTPYAPSLEDLAGARHSEVIRHAAA